LDGLSLGDALGPELGANDGPADGLITGEPVGPQLWAADGLQDGLLLGDALGPELGANDGPIDEIVTGELLGPELGATDGLLDGLSLRDALGPELGAIDGTVDGLSTGDLLGPELGTEDGLLDGLSLLLIVVVVVAINGFFVKMSSAKVFTSNSTHQAIHFCQFLVCCQDLVRGIVRRVEHEYLGRCEKFVRVIGPPVTSSPLVESAPQYYFLFFLFARTQNTGSRYR
jgi:hypothetical protein